MYKESYVPESVPGGGGFTVMKFTLENLYSMHKQCANWWTNSNQDLPLCRYLGCNIKCYQSKLIDYAIKYSNTQPAISNKLTYPSTHPAMLMMSQNKRIIPSKATKQKRKPYTKIHIPPPPHLENKWYFQKDIRTIPLLVLHTSAISLNEYYISTRAENNNITITSINPNFITNHDFRDIHWPYKKPQGTVHFYLYYYNSEGNKDHPENFLAKYLIPLTNIRKYTQGECYYWANRKWGVDRSTYCTHIGKYTGNPFIKENRDNENMWFYSNTGPQTFAEAFKTAESDEVKATELTLPTGGKFALTWITEPLLKHYRYNPFKDTGKSTKMFLLKCDDPTQGWDPPDNPDIIFEGFPLWLNIWGYTDFQIRLGTINNIMTNTLLCFQNTTTDPKTTQTIIPIDWDYLNDKSPYEQKANITDVDKWYPQLQYQTQQINNIAITGPGTPKQYPKVSDQVSVKYDFKFLWGGNPAKMITVSNPQKQIVYPMPSNEQCANSLQNPTTPPESLLYSFDQRHDGLTKQALERISKDWDFTEILSSITETTRQLPAIPTIPQEETQEKTAQEEEKEKLLLQLINHKQQQQQLRLGIIKLMKLLDL